MPGDSWKITLNCKREAAEALALSLSEAFDLLERSQPKIGMSFEDYAEAEL